MLGEYSELLYLLPILIRVAVGVIILAMIYDYLKRKWARMIVDTVKAAGAESPDSALSTAELEKARHGFGKAASFLLRKHSPLRRYVKSTTDAEDNIKFDIIGADKENLGTSEIDKKNIRKNKEEANKLADKSFAYSARKLSGSEKWYIVPPRPMGEEGEEDKEASAVHLPYLLRDGAEPKVTGVIIGCVLLAIFGEVIIHFLPQVINFFTSLAEIETK